MKYAPRKVYIKENGGYVELSYKDFCNRRESDQKYVDKLFIPVQGYLLEVVREQYADFYKYRNSRKKLQGRPGFRFDKLSNEKTYRDFVHIIEDIINTIKNSDNQMSDKNSKDL